MAMVGGLAIPVEAGIARYRGWIHSPAYDLLLFTLSPLSGLLLVALAQQVRTGSVTAIAFAFVAAPHYLSTFTFFFDDENRAYYRQRWVAFFLGPLLCAGLVFAAIAAGAATLFQAGIFTWNVYHVSRQSSGITGIYRALNGGAARERLLVVTALLASATAMVLVHVDRFQPLESILSRISTFAPLLLLAVASIVAVPTVVLVLVTMARRRASASEMLFFTSSVLLFHPYLWVEDSNLATLAMLMGHFVQYLSIVWLVHRRKHSSDAGDGSRTQRALGYISSHVTVTVGAIIAVGGAILALESGARMLGLSSMYLLMWNVLVLMHFYLDGVIWSFRHREIRQSIGSYLVIPTHRRSA